MKYALPKRNYPYVFYFTSTSVLFIDRRKKLNISKISAFKEAYLSSPERGKVSAGRSEHSSSILGFSLSNGTRYKYNTDIIG